MTGTGSRSESRRIREAHAGRGRRALAVTLLVLGLAALLSVGAALRTGAAPKSELTGLEGGLPAASPSSLASSMWDCPGPLPGGRSATRSAMVVVNNGSKSAAVQLSAYAVSVSNRGGSVMKGWAKSWTMPAKSTNTVSLASSAKPQSDAVSVLSSSDALAVFEWILPPSDSAAAGATPAQVESPCEVGTSAVAYVASGSTAGRSSVTVSVFNPTATEAVVGMRVSDGSSSAQPPALQGLIIPPYSVHTFAIGPWVVQQPTVAVTVMATAGQVAIGAGETVSSGSATGQSLVIGSYQTRAAWFLSPGMEVPGRTVAVRVYDPGTRAATVTISSPVVGGPSVDLTAVVPGEGALTVALPLATSRPKTPTTAPVQVTEGPITVRTAEGVGVVVARVVAVPLTGMASSVSYLAATSWPVATSVVPGRQEAVGTTLVLADPGSSGATVEVATLPPEGLASRLVARLTVQAGGRTSLELSSGEAGSALLVTATEAIVAETVRYPISPHSTTTLPVQPQEVAAVPVSG